MPLFLLENWKWLAPTLAAAGLGLLLLVAKAENASLRLDLAQIEAVSATTMAQAEKRAREAENRAAEAARTAEEQHAKDLAAIDATRDGFIDRLRQVTAARRCVGVPAAAAPAAQPAGVAGGSVSGPGEPVNPSAVKLRDAVKKLQSDVRVCWAWAATAGR